MVERQGGNHKLLAPLQHGAIDAEALLDVGNHVAVSQHGPLGETGSTAGVLQEGEIFAGNLRLDVLLITPFGQRLAHSGSVRQVVFGYQLLDVFHHEVDQGALGQTQVVTHAGQDDVLDRGVVDHFFQGMGEVGDDNDGLGAGVLELVLQLTRGIERVDVDHYHAGTQDAKHGDGVLQQVRHHHRDPIPLLQLQLVLQVGSKGAGLLFQSAVGDGLPHVDESGLVGELAH